MIKKYRFKRSLANTTTKNLKLFVIQHIIREGLTIYNQPVIKKKRSIITLHIVFGVVNDKDLDYIVDLLPENATYYFCKPNISRGLDAIELQKINKLKKGLEGEVYNICK